MNEEQLKVREVRPLGNHVFMLSLERDAMTFSPGDCLALFAEDGRVSRPYSIASGVEDDTVQFVIRHMPGGVVTSYLAGRKPGDIVRVSPPFGWFRPGEYRAERPFVFIATGTGVAPFRAFLRSVHDARPTSFLYGVRHTSDLVEAEWMMERGGAVIAVSREDSPYHRGRVTDFVEQLDTATDADYYLCGLDVMIDDITVMLEQRGVPITRIHRECFFNASY